MTKKIMCIDDVPEEEYGQHSLEKWLQKLFGDHYSLLIEKDPKRACELIESDDEIDVVLLDIDFDNAPLGREIAHHIYEIRQDIKVVVLTEIEKRKRKKDQTAEKRRFKQRGNVWFFYEKERLADTSGPTHLFRIVQGLLEDPYNEKWDIDVVYEDRIVTLTHKEYEVKESITFNNVDQLNTIMACLESRGECIDITEIEQSENYSLSKVVFETNNRILSKVHHRTWGILNSKNCANNSVSIYVGNKGKGESPPPSPSLECQVEGIHDRLDKIEKVLGDIVAKL